MRKIELILSIALLTMFFACERPVTPLVSSGEINVDAKVIYPKIRIWTSPASGEMVNTNSPSMQWPSVKKARYSIRLSQDRKFEHNVIEKKEIPFAIYNPHQKLEQGLWYWQYKVGDKEWNPVDSFRVGHDTKNYVTPDIQEVLSRISVDHPRVLVKKANFTEFRERAKTYKEALNIIDEANGYVGKKAPKESSAIAKQKGKNESEDKKLAILSSKNVGWGIYNTMIALSEAYVLTGDSKYFQTAKNWMMEVAKWDPKGPSYVSNFGDSGIMTGLAVGVDTFWDLLNDNERGKIIQHVSIRANGFYQLWISQVESRSSSMHVWQHILHRLTETSLALAGETPDADLWLEYIYEIWIAQCPKMAETDGAWFNGTGYFRMNTMALYDINSIFSELSGVDFMQHDWYRNNPRWLIYAFPPNSIADGFCNDGDKYERPNINYAGYADAAARELNDPYAGWYANEIASGLGLEITDDDEFRWYRIKRGYQKELPMVPDKFDLPQAAVFPDVGVAYMHSELENPDNNLMLSMRSSPFASMGHTHAEQNGFNISFGGKRLFYNTGYRPAMGDPHLKGWHKHTRGHNAILIDGKGQPFNAGAYGWIPRFLHGKQISYAVGDAANAYSAADMGEVSDAGVKRFRRHFVMLRPSIVVVYDELVADHKAEWTWLLHNDSRIQVDKLQKTLVADNSMASAQVNLYSSSDIEFKLTNEFSVPVENWTQKRDQEGNIIDFKNQWHFSGVSKNNTEKMRYLAIFQIKSKQEGEPCKTIVLNPDTNTYSIDGWNIVAELNCEKAAGLKITNDANTAVFVSSGTLRYNGKEYKGTVTGSSKLLEMIEGKINMQEKTDEVPKAIQNVMAKKQ